MGAVVDRSASPSAARQLKAAFGSLLFLVVAPGVVAGLIPWLMTGYETGEPVLALQIVGGALVLAGALVLLDSFARFALQGLGTPAPVAPTEGLVITGLYRHVRNPMYLAVASLIAGQALLLGRYGLLIYAAALLATFVGFVRLYEEPALEADHGDEYRAYRHAVPGWWPRLRAWKRVTRKQARHTRADRRADRRARP
jgi:protein-S-isoprenylcysteine O-methyltransferase Ste14